VGRKPIEIDREKLRAAVRELPDEYVFYMLDDAIEFLPPAKLREIVEKYLDPDLLRFDGEQTAERGLLANVLEFRKASLAGGYYESFAVNSRNYTEQSKGTTAWIARCRRLLDRWAVEEKQGDQTEVRHAFDTIFDLLDHIDECLDDVVFFADEGGSWQVGVDWEEVLPPWFRVLSATATPAKYAQKVTALLDHHYSYKRDEMLALARRTATPAQRRALAELAGAAHRSWRTKKP
jgi:hypothetical protein